MSFFVLLTSNDDCFFKILPRPIDRVPGNRVKLHFLPTFAFHKGTQQNNPRIYDVIIFHVEGDVKIHIFLPVLGSHSNHVRFYGLALERPTQRHGFVLAGDGCLVEVSLVTDRPVVVLVTDDAMKIDPYV